MTTPDPRLASESYCYLTTTGRRTCRPHEIEIWFSLHEGRLYMLAGGRERADWVRNLVAEPHVSVRIKDQNFAGRARPLEPDTNEDRLARRLLVGKYARSSTSDLSGWGTSALPVVVEFDPI